MNLSFSKEDQEFQQEVRSFIEQNYPSEIKEKQDQGIPLSKEDTVKWHKILNDKGWLAVNWPEELGGTGWTITQKHIFQNELAAANTPTLMPFGVNMCGPVIYTFGSDEQKEFHLPKILNGDIWWCQGYSEPGSGSDLASLKTKAEKKGDVYVVNGAKTWTTLAQHADWIFCLVRTDGSGKKQEGISFLLIDMKTPGVEVKPIITIDGTHEVNMVYFDNVEVPVTNLVGEEWFGWSISKFLLAHERTGIAGIPSLKRELDRLRDITTQIQVGEGSLKDDAMFMSKLDRLEIKLTAAEYTELRTLAAMSAGGHPGPESSILKILGTDLQQELSDLFVEAVGYYAHPFMTEEDLASNESRIGPDFAAPVMPHYLNYRKVSIYGGSNEIQRNVIAKAVLGL